MADATIDRINPADLETVTHLHNSIFRPERERAWIERFLIGRHNVLVQVARIQNDAVGFYIGMELRPNTHQGWLVGVVPEMRRSGIGTQLLRAAGEWAKEQGYRSIRFEVPNTVRPVLQFAIAEGFDITGVRYDHDLATNLVIFERNLLDISDEV
jgi:GNAT superfamily N-acetyltransferase